MNKKLLYRVYDSILLITELEVNDSTASSHVAEIDILPFLCMHLPLILTNQMTLRQH